MRFFPLFWVDFLIDRTPLLMTHFWGTMKHFLDTTEDKEWLKKSLFQFCNDNYFEHS